MWSFNFISVFALEAVLVDRVNIKMISFQLVVFLIVVDLVRDKLFSLEASLVD